MKGIYCHIRHPQYLALMISSLGMVLIWPRYLVLFGFVTVCFAYFLLARLEEKICLRDIPGYDTYLNKTGMFLPRVFEQWFQHLPWPSERAAKMLSGLVLYAILLLVSFWGAGLIHSYSIHSLYTWSTPGEVYLSVGEFDDREFRELIRIAKSNQQVSDTLSKFDSTDSRFINYVKPTDLLISEVPMYIPEGRIPSHRPPHHEDQSRYKIIFSTAKFGSSAPADGIEILKRAINKSPSWKSGLTAPPGRLNTFMIYQPKIFMTGCLFRYSDY